MQHRDVLLHPRASGAGVRGAGTWDRPPGPGAAQRVWAAPRNCSPGLGADVLAAVGFLHTAVGFYAALDSLWCRCSSSSFVEEMCLGGGGRTCTRGLCLRRWVLDTCFPSCLDVTRVLTLPSASKISNPDWSLFVRGADR